jgi:L-alanine-DL-glutamate epimerase-like enolase superfamily enzyme
VIAAVLGKIEKGFLYPPKCPALGFEPNKEMVKKYAASRVNKVVVE